MNRSSASSYSDINFRENTKAFISSDPEFGRASSRFDLILSSGIIPAGNHKIIPRAHHSEITWVQFNQDGTLFATGWGDGVIKIWDAKSMREIPIFMSQDLLLDFEYNNKWVEINSINKY